MKFLGHSPLKVEKLQFIGGVTGLSLCQTPTGIGNDGISPIIKSLIEGSPQTRPASISVQFKRLHKIGVGKNGCCGTQVLQVIKGPLAPAVPGDGCLLLTCVSTGHQFVQGLGYLCESVIEPNEPKKAIF